MTSCTNQEFVGYTFWIFARQKFVHTITLSEMILLV